MIDFNSILKILKKDLNPLGNMILYPFLCPLSIYIGSGQIIKSLYFNDNIWTVCILFSFGTTLLLFGATMIAAAPEMYFKSYQLKKIASTLPILYLSAFGLSVFLMFINGLRKILEYI
jgi:hypothetical protein